MTGTTTSTPAPVDNPEQQPCLDRPDGLRIRLLGHLVLNWGQDPLPLPRSATTRSLLAYLAVHHGEPLSRDVLAGFFWPDRPDAAARRALSQALWQIRRSLGPADDRLASEQNDIRLDLQDNDWLDVEDFESQINSCRPERGREGPPVTDLPDCLGRLSAAIRLYQDYFFPDCYDDWALLERERLRERYLWALEQLVALNKQWGDYRQALTYAQRLAAADPLREPAHRELMRLYHLLDRGHMALRQYQLLQQLLDDELGTEPSAATTSLYDEIVAVMQEAGPVHLPTALPPPVLGDLGHLPFIGREPERAALLEAVQAAAQGHGGMALIEGPAGVGKTRLVDEVVASARWRGFQVALGKSDPLVSSPPYQPLVDALTPLLTPLRIAQLVEIVEPLWLSAIAPLLEVFSEHRPDLVPLLPLEPEQEQRRLWEGLVLCLAGLAAIAPVLLVLEDLHWADAATLAALTSLPPRLPASHLLVVLTCRSAEARERSIVWETLGALDRALPLRRLILSPFAPEEATSLVVRALGTGRADRSATALAHILQDWTGGNALFLVEILKALLEQGALVPSPDGDWVFPSLEQPLPTPRSIQDLVGRRLSRLATALRSTLEWAAVLGHEADFSLLSWDGPASPAGLTGRLEDLCRRGFLIETGTGYCFEHDLVRQVVYEAINPQRRRSLHCCAGEVLEQLQPESIESLAYHFELGGRADQARDYTLRAAERAQIAYDYDRALACYDRALDLTSEDVAGEWDILVEQERVLGTLGRREIQGQVLARMLDLARILDDPLRLARTRYMQGWRDVLAGEADQALVLLEEAAGLARSVGEQDLLGDCLTAQARAWWRIGDTVRCQAAVEEAQAIFRQTGNRAGEGAALNMLGNFHLGLTGNYAQALVCFQAYGQLENSQGSDYGVAVAQGNAGITYTLLGLYRHSRKVLSQAYATMSLVGARNWQGIILHWQGANCRGLGDLTQAQEKAEEALQVCREVGDRNFEIAALELLGGIALDEHNPARALCRFEQSAQVARDNQQTMDYALQQSHLALAHLHLGRLEEADRLSAGAISTLEGLGESVSHSKEAYFERYQIVAAVTGPAPARPHLERAYRLLQAMADQIEDAGLRESFLQGVDSHQQIVTAYQVEQPPPIQVRMLLPRSDAPTGRPLRDDELVGILWTVLAPEDNGRPQVHRRRQRLRRLSEEAATQGASPTVADLASVLGVTPRTVKRDLAALRAEGFEVITRGWREN